jgi:hypothetical protein
MSYNYDKEGLWGVPEACWPLIQDEDVLVECVGRSLEWQNLVHHVVVVVAQ